MALSKPPLTRTARESSRGMDSVYRRTLAWQRPEVLQLLRSEGRGRGGEIPQQGAAIVLQAVGQTGGNEYAVAHADALRLVSDGHQAAPLQDEVDLLGVVAMDALFAARLQ